MRPIDQYTNLKLMKMIGIPFLAKIISNLSLGFFSPVPWYRDSLASIST